MTDLIGIFSNGLNWWAIFMSSKAFSALKLSKHDRRNFGIYAVKTPWSQGINWTYIRRSEDAQGNNNGSQCAYFVINGLQSASMNRHFLNVIHGTIEYAFEWYKFYNNSLSIVLGSKQGGRWNSWTPNTRTKFQFNCWLSQY